MDARTARTADRHPQHRRGREDLRPRRRRGTNRRRHNPAALDTATAPIRSGRPDRHRPHRRHSGPGCRVRNAGQRADGTAGRLPPPVEEPIPGLKRYRVASKIIKGQGLGGTDDEWVVIEPVHRAIELLEQLHDDPRDGALLLSRFSFRVRYLWFRDLGEFPGRSPPRTRPDPRRTGDTAYAQQDGRVGDGLPARRGSRSKTAPQTYRCGNYRGLCCSTGRRSGGVAGAK